MQVTIENYTVTNSFYVVDTNVVLGVKWLYSIGNHTIYYQFFEMIFKDADGKEVVLRGVNTHPKQVVSVHSMRSILRHGDIEWDSECHITTEGNSINVSYYPKDIKKLLHKHKGFFEKLPH